MIQGAEVLSEATENHKSCLNILVVPGGTEIGLEINAALRDCKDICLFAAGQEILSHTPYVFARYFTMPSVHEQGWLEAINDIIHRCAIDYVIPAHDDVVVALAENAIHVNAGIVSSPLETCQITRSKSHTYRLLGDIIPTPAIYDDPAAITDYPVFVKPDRGQGSQGAVLVHDREQLQRLLVSPGNIVLEYLPGEEFTIDCFSDREQGLLYCSGRVRSRTRSGISMSSRSVDDPIFELYARRITERLTFHGAWFYQLKIDRHGEYKLLEVAPRIAGTMALHRVKGVNFPLLSIYEQERLPIAIRANDVDVVIDRALVNRYRHDVEFGTVYVDLDDTLILNGEVNTPVVAFLYQCLNQGKRIVLLTRHAGDLPQTLSRFRLSGLFDKIIHVPRSVCKSEFINEVDAILIDDSFSERESCRRNRGILTFDCSMIEMLMDDRA